MVLLITHFTKSGQAVLEEILRQLWILSRVYVYLGVYYIICGATNPILADEANQTFFIGNSEQYSRNLLMQMLIGGKHFQERINIFNNLVRSGFIVPFGKLHWNIDCIPLKE